MKTALFIMIHNNSHYYPTFGSAHALAAKGFAADRDDAQQMAIEHGRWCWEVGITSTPTMFLNGYRFPELYRLTDITWLLSAEIERPGPIL